MAIVASLVNARLIRHFMCCSCQRHVHAPLAFTCLRPNTTHVAHLIENEGVKSERRRKPRGTNLTNGEKVTEWWQITLCIRLWGILTPEW